MRFTPFERWSAGVSNLAFLLLLVLCAGLVWLAVVVGCYFLTHKAYESMIAGPHCDRSEVEAALAGFKERIISDEHQMSGELSSFVEPGMKYIRYTRYGGLGIDVVYDRHDRVVAVWPEYD